MKKIKILLNHFVNCSRTFRGGAASLLLIKRIILALFGPYSRPRVPKEIMIASRKASGNIIHEESLGTGGWILANYADKGSPSSNIPQKRTAASPESVRSSRILRCDESVNPIFIVINDSRVGKNSASLFSSVYSLKQKKGTHVKPGLSYETMSSWLIIIRESSQKYS